MQESEEQEMSLHSPKGATKVKQPVNGYLEQVHVVVDRWTSPNECDRPGVA
jgi:hypothetical protein